MIGELEYSVAFGLVFGASLLVAIYLFVRQALAEIRRVFDDLASALNAEVTSTGLGYPTITTLRDGIPLKIYFQPGSQYNPAALVLESSKKPPFTLQLSREGFDTRVSKSVGMAKELNVGVRDFDDRFFIKTNNDARCRDFLASSSVRETIIHLDDLNASLALSAKSIEIRKLLRPTKPQVMNLENLKKLDFLKVHRQINRDEVLALVDDFTHIAKSLAL